MDAKFIEEINELKLRVLTLEEEIKALKEENAGNGVFLNGSPEYVREFLVKKRADGKLNGGI